jgi:hypothetical protein
MVNKYTWNDLLIEVKQIFPNATIESIKLSKTLRKIDFCWCYGEVSIKNYPNKYHKQIIKINEIAKRIREV